VHRGQGLIAEPDVWDFGTIERGASAAESIMLTNRGADTLHVSLHSTCACLEAQPSEFTLPPGEKTAVELSYIGDEIKAPLTKTIFIDSEDSRNPRIAFKVTGSVAPGELPHLATLPDPLPLDPSAPSYPVAVLVLANRGKETLKIGEITCFGCINSWDQMELAAGEEVELEITPLPDWNERRWLEVKSNDPVHPLKRITIVEFD
jgi:hypothetical protein